MEVIKHRFETSADQDKGRRWDGKPRTRLIKAGFGEHLLPIQGGVNLTVQKVGSDCRGYADLGSRRKKGRM